MRSIRFLPLVFIIGIDGFAMFAPYVTVVLAMAYVITRLRSTEAAEEPEEIVPVTA